MLIQQRTRHDCAICTIAMAISRTYEEVRDAADKTEAWHPEKGIRSEYLVLEAFGLEQMVHFRLMHRRDVSPEFFLHFAWKRRAILAVPSLNNEGGFHSVYYDGAQLFDPCDLKTYTRWEDLRPNEIILFASPLNV